MSNVIPMNPKHVSVAQIIEQLSDAQKAGNLTHLMVVGLGAELRLTYAVSSMSNERRIWMADWMMRKAREEQA